MRLRFDSTSGQGYLFVVAAWVKIMVSLILLQDLSTFCIGTITMPFTRGTPLCTRQHKRCFHSGKKQEKRPVCRAGRHRRSAEHCWAENIVCDYDVLRICQLCAVSRFCSKTNQEKHPEKKAVTAVLKAAESITSSQEKGVRSCRTFWL